MKRFSTNKFKLLFSAFIISIGAILLAPKCYAVDYTEFEFNPPSDEWPCGNDIAEQIFSEAEQRLSERYPLASTYIRWCGTIVSNSDTLYVCQVTAVDTSADDLKFYYDIRSGRDRLYFNSSNINLCGTSGGSYRVYNDDRQPVLSLPTGTIDVSRYTGYHHTTIDGVGYYTLPVNVNALSSSNPPQCVNFSGRTIVSSSDLLPIQPVRPLLFGDYTVTEPPKDGSVLAYEYVAKYGFKSITATAWLRNEQGRMFKIPISYTPPDDYTGLYCRPYQVSSTLYGYKVALTPGENPLDYEYYWDMHLVIEYEDVSFTTLDAYIVLDNTKFGPDTMLYKDPSDFEQFENQTTEQGYFNLEGTSYIGTLAHMEFSKETSTSLYFAGRWWEEKVGVSDMIIGISFVSTDENGDTTAGKGSEDYNKFLEEYTKAIMLSLTGYDNGPSSFQADWSGQSLSSTATYNNNFTFSDNTGKTLFTKLFSMGNGFVLTASVGVLSIAIAAYVLFGKS